MGLLQKRHLLKRRAREEPIIPPTLVRRKPPESKMVTQFVMWDFVKKQREIFYVRIMKEYLNTVWGVLCDENGNPMMNPHNLKAKYEAVLYKPAIKRRSTL